MKEVLVLLLILRSSFAVIYSVNESEYNRMPALYALDEYTSCLLEPGGTYCLADFHLFSDGDSALMNMIQEYSDQTMKHFNHTEIHRGICVTKTCENFIKTYSLNKTEDLSEVLEACLNESIWRNYNIQATLLQVQYCNRSDEKSSLDSYDILVAVIYIVLIALNVIGSSYDILVCRKRHKSVPGNPYLLAFSIQRNWEKMVTPAGKGSDPRLERLRLFHGMRVLTMICVFFSHTVLIMAYSYINNPLYIEKSYEDPGKQILFNGSLVVHTFFVMSAFLLSYNLQIYAEKHKINWIQWPKGVMLRWLRLTPTYALILATISTWMRHLGTGPVWDLVVDTEVQSCRQYWWAHLLYINNYIYGDAWCAPQTWYLAADTQMFCLALLICVLAKSRRARCWALGLTFLGSVAALALQTYFQDLEAVVIQSPEKYRNLYAYDDTFRLLYIRGHTNLCTYTLGLAAGFLAYHWQTKGKNLKDYKNYRWLFWLAFPLGVAAILSGGFFYSDGSAAPGWLRVTYAALYKPVFQLFVLTIVMGTVFKIETLYRGVLEWRGWTWAGRVSYSAFLLHTLFQRSFIGAYTTLIHMSDFYVMVVLSSTILFSYVGGCGLWLCVEGPVGALTRALMQPGGKRPGAKLRGHGEGEGAE